MKACVLHGIGDLRFEEVAKPAPQPGEVLIRIKACGVCGSDIPRVFEKGTYRFPLIPGHEFSGVVEAAGADGDAGLVGRRVAVFPLIPCRQCGPCEIGAFAQCEHYDYLGSRRDGAFAEYVTAPAWNLALMGDGLSFEEAAMVEPAAVAAHALRKAGLDLGDSVLIVGAGPIGLMLAGWARHWGARRVMLADIDEAKLDFARGLGYALACNPRRADLAAWVKEQTGRGADVVVEASGSSAAFEQCMGAARAFGKVVLMGNPAGEMKLSQAAYWAVLRKELTVTGTWNSVFGNVPKNEWELSLAAMAEGKLDLAPLVTHRISLERLPEAMAMMRNRSAFFNKVLMLTEG